MLINICYTRFQCFPLYVTSVPLSSWKPPPSTFKSSSHRCKELEMILVPLSAWVVCFLQNASLLTRAIASRCTRRAASKVVGIAKDSIVLNKVNWLMRIRMEMIPRRFAIVTYLFLAVFTGRESVGIADSQNRNTIRIIIVVAQVDIYIKEIKSSLQFTLIAFLQW